MDPTEKTAFGFIILGLVTLLAIFWQYKLCRKDLSELKSRRRKFPKRLKFGSFLCILLLAGIATKGFIAIYLDKKDTYDFIQMGTDLKNSAYLSGIFLVKSYFGPLITMGSLAIACYFYFQYGEIGKLPIVSQIMDLSLSFAPDWLDNFYMIFYSGFAFVTSLMDTKG